MFFNEVVQREEPYAEKVLLLIKRCSLALIKIIKR